MERGALKGHGALLLANVIWGLNSPICKTVLLSPENPEGLNHFALTVYRLVGAFLLFWLASAFLPRERVAWRDLGGLFIASLFGIQLDQILFLWGLSLTSPINVSIIATTVPILTMILAMFFLREPITPLKTGGVLLGAAGAVLLILISSRGESGGGSIAGDIITLVSSVCYAIYLTACRKVILKYSPVTTMKWMFFFAAIVVVVLYHRPALEVDFPAVPARVWGGAAFAIVLSTFLAYLMVPIAQHYLRPTVISMYNYVQPVASVLFTVVLGLDVFGFTKAAAAGCIFLGVWLVTMSKSRKDLEAEQAVKMTDKKEIGRPPQATGRSEKRAAQGEPLRCISYTVVPPLRTHTTAYGIGITRLTIEIKRKQAPENEPHEEGKGTHCFLRSPRSSASRSIKAYAAS